MNRDIQDRIEGLKNRIDDGRRSYYPTTGRNGKFKKRPKWLMAQLSIYVSCWLEEQIFLEHLLAIETKARAALSNAQEEKP